MSAVYDFESDSIFVSAYELCSYVLRGGDINSNGYNLGNKNGHAIVSHKMNKNSTPRNCQVLQKIKITGK